MALDRLTKIDGGGISTTSDYRVGIITATKFVGPIEGDLTGSITATTGTFSGNVSIGGTLTYEDVTNIDSVGIITAREAIDLPTDKKILLGDNDKFEIYKTSTHARITNKYGGGSWLRLGSGNGVILESDAGHKLVRGIVNGKTELYYSNSLKTETYSNGLRVIGNVAIDESIVHYGDSDTKIKFPAADTITAETAGSERLRITSDGNVLLNNDLDVDGHTNLDNVSVAGISTFGVSGISNPFQSDWATKSMINLYGSYGGGLSFNDNGNNGFQLFTTSAGVNFHIKNAAVGGTPKSSIQCVKDGAVELYYNNTERIRTTNTGAVVTGILTATGMVKPADGILINGGNISLLDRSDGSNHNLFFGTGARAAIYHDGSGFSIVNNTGHSYIGVGVASKDLYLYAQASGNVLLQQNTGVRYVKGVGSDASVQLFFNNNEKLKTTNTGITVQGSVYALGTTPQLRLNSDTSDGSTTRAMLGMATSSNNFVNGSTANDVVLNCPKDFIISHGTTELMAHFKDDSSVELFCDSTMRLQTTTSGISVTGEVSTTGHIRLPDNMALIAGNGSDLFIYHNGSSSVIDDVGTGSLKIQTNGTGVDIQKGSSETIARFIADGAVELYHDNAKVFNTDANGIMVLGQEGGTANVYIYADEGDDNNDKFQLTSNGGGTFIIGNRASGSVETNIQCNGNGAVELYHDDTKRFETTSNGNRTNGELLYLGPNNITNFVHSGGNLSMTADSSMFFVADCNDDSGVAPNGEFIFGGGSNTNTDANQDFTTAEFGNNGQPRNQYMILDENSLRPANNNNLDLGTSSLRWKTIYTMDLELSNKGSSNSVDGTWGDWTLQEGENDIYMINNRTGKKFKIKMEAVD